MKRLVVALFLILGFYIMSPILKLGVSTASAQQEPQPEGTPVQEPEKSESMPEQKTDSIPETNAESMPEQKTDSIPETKAESMPEQNPEPKPEKPDAEQAG
jgi:hypothetical protein